MCLVFPILLAPIAKDFIVVQGMDFSRHLIYSFNIILLLVTKLFLCFWLSTNAKYVLMVLDIMYFSFSSVMTSFVLPDI